MKQASIAFVASLVLSALASPPAAAQLRPEHATARHGVDAHRTARAHDIAVPRMLRAPDADPFAPVYIITSRKLFRDGLGLAARNAVARRDSLGTELVLAEVQAHQLAGFSHFVHEREKRCGGYFAFATRAEAEAFLRNDRSAKIVSAKSMALPAIDNHATVAPWLPQVAEGNIRATIQHLSTAWPNRYHASTHGHNSALWIRDTWLALGRGRTDVNAELFTACGNCGGQPSVILTVLGTDLRNEIVVVGGHLDSISGTGSGNGMNAPGADDDASGIATITEVIRIALAGGWKPRRTVKFMGYAAEEVGLRGSHAIAQSFRAQGLNVVGALQLDMTNYAAGSTYAMRLMTDYSNPAMQQFVTSLFDAYLAPLGLTRATTTCGYACSDHASWTAAGYPSAMMAEPTFFTRLHTTTDTLPYMGNSANTSVNFAKLGLAFVGELAKTEVPRRRHGGQPLLPPAGTQAVTASQSGLAAMAQSAARRNASPRFIHRPGPFAR